MKKRLYSSVVGLFVCLGCCSTCSPEPSLEAMFESSFYQPKQLENGCNEYLVNRHVILNRPLRCYPEMYYSARAEEYAGKLVWRDISHQTEVLFRGKEYIEIPAGTKLFLQKFFVNAYMRTRTSNSPDGEEYFLTLTIPSRSDLEYTMAYFMGDNGTLQLLPWSSEFSTPPPGAFRAVDIENLFPGGNWIMETNSIPLP